MAGEGEGSRERAAEQESPELVRTFLASKISICEFLRSECELSGEDYRLMSAMNLAATERYAEMADYVADLAAVGDRLHDKAEAVAPQLAQVDALLEQLSSIEVAVARLDGVSRRLEARYLELADRGGLS